MHRLSCVNIHILVVSPNRADLSMWVARTLTAPSSSHSLLSCPFVLSFSALLSSVRPARSSSSTSSPLSPPPPPPRPSTNASEPLCRGWGLWLGGGGEGAGVSRRRLCADAIKEGGLRGHITPLVFVTVYKSVEFTGSTFLWPLAPSYSRSENRHQGFRETIRPILCGR